MFYEKGVLRNFANSTGKYLSQNLIFNKVPDHRLAIFLKRDSGTGVFLFTEHLWTIFCNVLENGSKQSLSVFQEPMYKLVIF